MIKHVFKFKLGRFGVVGIISTLIYVVIAMAGARWTALPPLVLNVVAFSISGVWSYVGHYHITFRSDAAHGASLVKFFVLLGTGYAVSTAIVYGNARLGLPPELGTIVVTGFLPVMNFIVMQLWVFTSGRVEAPLAGARPKQEPAP